MTRRSPLIRQGEGPQAAADLEHEHHTERQRQQLAHRSAPDPPDTPNLNAHLSLIGDELQLRGIPVQAQGVGGAIAGTRPGQRITQ